MENRREFCLYMSHIISNTKVQIKLFGYQDTLVEFHLISRELHRYYIFQKGLRLTVLSPLGASVVFSLTRWEIDVASRREKGRKALTKQLVHRTS